MVPEPSLVEFLLLAVVAAVLEERELVLALGDSEVESVVSSEKMVMMVSGAEWIVDESCSAVFDTTFLSVTLRRTEGELHFAVLVAEKQVLSLVQHPSVALVLGQALISVEQGLQMQLEKALLLIQTLLHWSLQLQLSPSAVPS